MKGPNRSLLGNHIDLLTGYPFKSEHYTESETGIPLLRGDNVIQGSIRWDAAKRWPVNLSDGLGKYYLREGDFVIAMDRTWVKSGLKAAMLTKNDIPCLLVQRVARLRPKNRLDTYFLSLLIRSHEFEQYVKGVQTETAVPHISPQQIKDFPVILPPLPEQSAIASLLSTWDTAIEKTERLIEAKEKRRTWLARRLFIRTYGMQKDCIPWKEVHIGELFELVNRKNSRGVARVLTASGTHGLVDQSFYFNRSVASESLEGYYHLQRGEFAYNRSSMIGYPYGAIKRLDEYDEGVLSTLYICFAPKSGDLFPDFYKHYFECGALNKQLREIVQVGARAHGLLNVTAHDFFSLKIPLPPIKEQEKLAAVLDVAEQEIDLLKKQAEAYHTQKRGLMQKLLTGTWRVKVDNNVD